MQHTMFVLKEVIFVKLQQLEMKSHFKKIIKCAPKNTADVRLKCLFFALLYIESKIKISANLSK